MGRPDRPVMIVYWLVPKPRRWLKGLFGGNSGMFQDEAQGHCACSIELVSKHFGKMRFDGKPQQTCHGRRLEPQLVTKPTSQLRGIFG